MTKYKLGKTAVLRKIEDVVDIPEGSIILDHYPANSSDVSMPDIIKRKLTKLGVNDNEDVWIFTYLEPII